MKTFLKIIGIVFSVLIVTTGCKDDFYNDMQQSQTEMLKSGSTSYITKFSYKGKTYYVDAVNSGTNAEIWLRLNKNSCSKDDIKYMKLNAYNTTIKDAGSIICRAKSTVDKGKTILGCGATVGTGICAIAAVPSGGTAAAVCSGTVIYTVNKGFADCVSGVSSAIAKKLGKEKDWQTVMIMASVSNAQWSTAIDNAIDYACADIVKKKK